MITARDITKGFDGERVLDRVSLRVARGEVLGLVGPGGAGKSLLLKVLCGLVVPDGGTVEVLGQDLGALDFTAMAALRDQFGMLFQNYALFDFMTVGQNVAFPLEQRGDVPAAEIARRVDARLRDVDLPGTEAMFPRELSGGMKKRVALARATIAHAPLLLYDDPTAGLDPVTSSKIFNLIRSLHSREGASVIVGHDVDRMVSVCHRWVLLFEGRVRFDGTTAEARASTDPVVQTFFRGADGVIGAGA